MKEKISLFNFIYNLSEKKLAELYRYINKNFKNNFIQFLQLSAKTSVLFALKLDDKLWLDINYYELNVITMKNCYSLLLINKIMNCLNEIMIFIKIDIKNAYYQICICKNDEWKTAFWTQYKLYKYLIMLFKLINVSAIFQSYIHKMLCEHLNIFVIVFLNDILIYLKNKVNHQQHIYTVLKILLEAELYVKLIKY